MVEEIGHAAGVVWQHLTAHGESTVYQLRKGTGLPDARIHEALGWLAREGKLQVRLDGKVTRISLVPEP